MLMVSTSISPDPWDRGFRPTGSTFDRTRSMGSGIYARGANLVPIVLDALEIPDPKKIFYWWIQPYIIPVNKARRWLHQCAPLFELGGLRSTLAINSEGREGIDRVVNPAICSGATAAI
nr:hypothetical protein Iba_chr12aCG12500 [Ipomoea batatas]